MNQIKNLSELLGRTMYGLIIFTLCMISLTTMGVTL